MIHQNNNWSTKVIRIDADTGEEITERHAYKYYTLIKNKKEIIYVGNYKDRRILQITKLYRNKQQLELGF